MTGAKAVVRQMEGNVAQNDLDWENRAYSTVQEAIDSLGDADPTSQDTKVVSTTFQPGTMVATFLMASGVGMMAMSPVVGLGA